jgi:hypothetical protein
VLTPTDKGNIAEAKLAAAAIELGLGVCLPIGDGYVITNYTSREIDAVGAYGPELDRCYLLPIAGIRGSCAPPSSSRAVPKQQAAGR